MRLWAPIQADNFLFKFLFEIRLSSEPLEPLIGFPSYLEAKWWHKKLKVVTISTPTNGNMFWITPSLYMAITRRQIRLESCSSPLKTREDMWFRLRKIVWLEISFVLLMFTQWEDVYAYLFTFWWRHHPLGADQSNRFSGSNFFGF